MARLKIVLPSKTSTGAPRPKEYTRIVKVPKTKRSKPKKYA